MQFTSLNAHSYEVAPIATIISILQMMKLMLEEISQLPSCVCVCVGGLLLGLGEAAVRSHTAPDSAPRPFLTRGEKNQGEPRWAVEISCPGLRSGGGGVS